MRPYVDGLHTAAKALASSSDRDVIAGALVDEVERWLDVESAVLLLESGGAWAVAAASSAIDPPGLSSGAVDVHCLVHEGRAIRTTDIAGAPQAELDVYADYAFAPVEIGGPVFGLLGARRSEALAGDELKFLCALAALGAEALDRARALAELRELNRALEARVAERTEELSSALRDLAETQALLIESEKHRAIGRLVAGILHELNTPLGVMRSSTATLVRALEQWGASLEGEPPRPLRAARSVIASAEESGARMSAVLASLARLTAIDQGERRMIDVPSILEDCVTALRMRIEGRVAVDVSLAGDLPQVVGDPARLNQAFLTILENAVEALPEGGTLQIRGRRGADAIEVEIEDDGPGIPEDQLAEIFDAGLTQKGGRVAMRSGLFAARHALLAMGGAVTIESRAGEGTTVQVSLPIERAAPA